jgi:hypothetical protein
MNDKAVQHALAILTSRWTKNGDSYPDLPRKYHKLVDAFCEQREKP